jgi:RNA-binding protein
MLSSKQRAFLKKEAHKLDPIVRIGKDGLESSIGESLKNAFFSRELVKVKILQNSEKTKEEVYEIADILAKETESEVVAIIGRIIIFYKENDEKPVISSLLKRVK